MPASDAAIVFDCDGLLVNTQAAWDLAYTTIFAHYGTVLEPHDRRSLVGMELVPLGHHLAELLGHPTSSTRLGVQALELMRSHLGDGLGPMPGAVELVAALAGSRPLAVASNAPTAVVLEHLGPFFDPTWFTAVVGSDHVAHPKPSPDVYLAACTALASAPNTAVALEDSPTGAIAAVSAGMYVVGVPHHPEAELPCHLRVRALTDPRLQQLLGVPAMTSHLGASGGPCG